MFIITVNLKVKTCNQRNINRLHFDIYYCFHLLHRLIYQYTHFSKLKTYICRFYYSRFSWICQQIIFFFCYVLNIFVYKCVATMTSLIYCRICKNRIPSLYLLNNCISARSALQMLSAYCWFWKLIPVFVIVKVPADFLSKSL